MAAQGTDKAELEIGKFVCPATKATVPLKAAQPLAFLRWPVTVQRCPSCGETHELNLADRQHPPVYGYE